jgi:hypothetical protein
MASRADRASGATARTALRRQPALAGNGRDNVVEAVPLVMQQRLAVRGVQPVGRVPGFGAERTVGKSIDAHGGQGSPV